MRLLADELGNLLRAHGYLHVERPPELWDVETTELEPFVRVMGEVIAACLARNGGELESLVLSVANVHVAADSADPLPAGDLVALSVTGPGDWADASWVPDQGAGFVNTYLPTALSAAGAVYAYSRRREPSAGSLTALYRRWTQ
jgi:hypothetical protein